MTVTSERPSEDAARLPGVFLPKAFRRKVSPEEVQDYVAIARARMESNETFEDAMKEAYNATLCSPDFLFTGNAGPNGQTDKPEPLGGRALADRLALWLWNRLPDDALCALADEGAVNDPRSKRFVNDFVDQWLYLRKLDAFRRDDQDVMSRAVPKLNIVELFFNRQGIPDWFITHKLPVTDRNGRVIGVMGTTRSYTEAKQVLQPYLPIDRAVACIRERFREKITVRQLASHVHLSERQLHRKFLEAFGSSPQAFILKVRVQAACDQFQQGERPLSDLAYETRFADQSSFTQHFQRHMGMTPLKYRRQFRLVQPQEGGKQG